MAELSTERLVDPFGKYMKYITDFEFNDVFIDELSLKALSRFANEDGSFTKSFDAAIKDNGQFSELFIITSTAYYESENGEIPAVQARIIDDNGQTLYYSPVYEIGHSREYYRRQWRIMPTFERYTTLRLSFIIPEGVKLYIKNINARQNYGFRERDIGIRYHGHGGCTNLFGMQLTAEAGFTSCITIVSSTSLC